MRVAVSWSGGKDACFAAYEAKRQGHAVSHLLNFVTDGGSRIRAHGLEADVIRKQSLALGIPLVQAATSWEGYEAAFKKAVTGLKADGVTGVVFGDVYVQEHKDWVERVCREIGVTAMEPLWGIATEDLFARQIGAGFKGIVVSVKAGVVDEKWLGHAVDDEFAAWLRGKNLDVCGEKGEYHTLVVDGPGFLRPLKLRGGMPVNRGKHWFLEGVEVSLGG
jgi:uncharacterized protein (TIGR00290 family)